MLFNPERIGFQELLPLGTKQTEPIEILYYFDQPLTFTFKNDMGELMLAHLMSDSDEISRYIAANTSDEIISQLKSGTISLFAALNQPEVLIMDVGVIGEKDGKIIQSWTGKISDIPDGFLPALDVTLYRSEHGK